MIFNLVHKPTTSDTYDFQRKCAHDLKLKVTILLSSESMNNDEIVKKAVADHEKYGDEIGIWLTPLEGMPDTQVWLLSEEDKMTVVKTVVDKYKELFGCAPKVISNYVLDCNFIKMIKDYCPEVTTCVAGCFEEGVKVFHGCNNSWYLFSEGMSWNPWYPSKDQSIRPAENEDEWAGVVALPHLSRDLCLGYESRNDFFASHPANIQRGLANEGRIHEYDYNLVDQYRMQEDFNDWHSYYQINVNPGWLHNNINIIDPDEVTQALYLETLEYIAELRDKGEVVDMHMSEYGEYFRKNVPIGYTEIAVGKDLLYGSGKHYCWVYNPDYRVLVDTFQGGSIGDLRPFIGKYASFTGTDSPSLTMNSYPYLIQSQYRSGVKHHCFDGSRTTVFVKHAGEELDMCFYPTKVEDVKKDEKGNTKLILTPATLKFKDGLVIKVQTVYDFNRGGDIVVTRNIVETNDTNAEIEMQEYVKACFGFTEYPENMKDIDLYVGDKKVCDYGYQHEKFASDTENEVTAVIPNITTKFGLAGVSRKPDSVEIEGGHLFTPYYVMKANYKLGADEKEVKSCLKLRKA